MYYPEFKKSSKKHLIACECLLSSVENSCINNATSILATVFYLSGYILETIMKFSIYSAIGYQRNKKVELLKDSGLEFKQDIKIHNLLKLKRTIEEKSITRIDTKENNKLFHAWDSEIRYKEKVDYSKEEIHSFFEFAKQTYINIQRYK